MLRVARAKKGRHGIEKRCCDGGSWRTSRFAASISFRFFCEIVVCFVVRYFCVYDRFSGFWEFLMTIVVSRPPPYEDI